MKSPTPSQVRIAVEVLKRLEARLNQQGAHGIAQVPKSRAAQDYAAGLEERTLEHVGRIKLVTAQLESWHRELQQERKHRASHRF